MGVGYAFVFCGYTAPRASQSVTVTTVQRPSKKKYQQKVGVYVSCPQKGPLSNLSQATETDSDKF